MTTTHTTTNPVHEHRIMDFPVPWDCTGCGAPATGWHYGRACGCGDGGWEVQPCGCRHAGVDNAAEHERVA